MRKRRLLLLGCVPAQVCVPMPVPGLSSVNRPGRDRRELWFLSEPPLQVATLLRLRLGKPPTIRTAESSSPATC